MEAQENNLNFSLQEQKLLLIFALRYSMNRNSTALYSMKKILEKNSCFLTNSEKETLIEEINENIKNQQSWIDKKTLKEIKKILEK